MTPVWQRGYRCHGYWLGIKRVGFVGLDVYQGGRGNVKQNGYSWGLDSEDLQHPPNRPRVFSLKVAKRLVEEAYRKEQE